jgi:hypothetical protein
MDNIDFDLVRDAVKWMATTLMDMSTVQKITAEKE